MTLAKEIRTALIILLCFTFLLGIGYPIIMTGIAKIFFNNQANGSVVQRYQHVVGSALIGQRFNSMWYFSGRPSAAGNGYDATASGGSNLGPTNRALIRDVLLRAHEEQIINHNYSPVPIDLITSSGSGLDPAISPQAAYFQAARIAKQRKLRLQQVYKLIRQQTKNRQLGFLGEPQINVLALNIALDIAAKNPHTID